MTKIDEEAKEYMDQAKEFSPDEKNRRIGDINKSFTKCKEYGDDKLSLAMQVSQHSGLLTFVALLFCSRVRKSYCVLIEPLSFSASKTYDMIDKHIRKLDADLARFEADLKEKAMNARGGSNSGEGETSNKKDRRKAAAESKKQKVGGRTSSIW